MNPKTDYRFVSETGLDVTMLRGLSGPKIVGGYGGWEVVSRMRRTGITNWVGRDPISLDVPIMFDGFADETGQEVGISILSRMALPDLLGTEPPPVRIYGAIPRRDITRWVIRDITWDDQETIWQYSNSGVGARLRQDATVHFYEFIDEDRVQMSSASGVGFGPGGAPGARPTPRHPFHIVKAGDTMAKISLAEYGNAKYARDIIAANKIRDPKNILVGQKLRMP